MTANYNLASNESVILKEVNVAHGGAMAVYTDELMLTNLNIVCLKKGMFGNVKKVFVYPLSQIKRYNGKPQAMMGKLSNGTAALEVYFINGTEQFNFQGNNKNTITKWINEINKVLLGDSAEEIKTDSNDYDSNTLVGAFKEVGGQFKEVGSQLMGAFGFTPKTKSSIPQQIEKVNKKCISCSAPLTGTKGQVVRCKYCDTEQTL